MSKPLQIFITYAHKDTDAKDELITNLAVMKRDGLISIWHDNEITPGDTWRDAISNNLHDSDMLIYLVSAYSLDSENCNKELAEALSANIKVIPIILTDCDWKNDRLSDFQALPDRGKPISEWERKSAGWQNVVEGIRRTISKIQSQIDSSGESGEELQAESVFQQGNVLMMLGQTGKAVKAYTQSIDLNSCDARAYNNRGAAYRNNEDFDLAIQDFNKSKQLKSNFEARDSTDGFVKLDMPLEKMLNRITFIVTDLSGESNKAVVFEGEGVTANTDHIILTQNYEENGHTYYAYYILLPQYTVEGNRYIFVPLAQSGGGSGVFWDLNVVDKKTLRTVDEVGIGDRAKIEKVTLVSNHNNAVTITYIERTVNKNSEVVYNPSKAIERHFQMKQGILKEVNFFEKTVIPLSSSYADMVLIPGNEFDIVSNTSDSGKKTIHTVYIDAFYMDKYEVTNAQYKEFSDANPQWQKDRIPKKYHDGNYLKDWNGNNYPISKGSHPVASVSWYGAMAYAKWIGKRLPTQMEWEKAARGGLTGQKYPWGNSIDPSKANYSRNVGDTTPVGSYPPNEYDLYDMMGNVWEWCIDEHDYEFYQTSLHRYPIVGADKITEIINDFLSTDSSRVLRGGSWIRFARDIKVSDRDYAYPTFSNDDFGFRCVMDVKR